jgi:predicted RNA binding protein YcfA (HicA-like mRNA interferase family)
MSRIPALTAWKVIQALKRAGFVEDRQKGSHLVLVHSETEARTVAPVDAGRTISPVKEPLLRAIVRDANLSADEFIELL